MTSSPFTCTWLLLSCCILLTFSTSELEFYQDAVPETSEDVARRDFARFLETQGHQHLGLQRAHFNPFLTNQARKKHHLEVNRQKERDLLETLNDKATLSDLFRKEKLDEWNYHRQMQYNEPVNEVPQEREYDHPYYDLNSLERAFEYPKLPYLTHKPSRENAIFNNNENLEYQQEISPVKQTPYERVDFEKGMKEVPIFESHRNYGLVDRNLPENEENLENLRPVKPKFTFRFDDANIREEHPFAVKPNDPRYYTDAPFSMVEKAIAKHDKASKNETKWERIKTPTKEEHTTKEYEETTESTKHHKMKDTSMITVPEPDRRTGGNHPLVVPVNRDLNNDIYFIAIVAGCSAAAMFALVLISLTWCRLQRGVKAAADIEYPAYGVTGPNKDVSPSGDQRLAQSAQMYHFQHQKQQIIAMENRTSATRDPGSVSEAESDEENEEGDYTVYECPGLASTGEMEVKNPLFHDDPTPATPAQTTKEEDHI